MLKSSVGRFISLGTRNQEFLEQLEISGGNKGYCDLDAKVKSADVDIHSSYGGVIESAPWYPHSSFD